MRRVLGLGFTGFVSVCALAAVCGAEPKVEEQVVGPPWDQGTIYTISPKGMHLATAGMKGSRYAVTVDGVEGPKVDAIFMSAAEFVELEHVEGGLRIDDRTKWQGPVAFSPDGTRSAYGARVGKETVVFLDGKEVYRGMFTQDQAPINKLSFTDDSKHLLFFARTMDTMMSYALCVDGKPIDAPAFSTATFAHYSPDGTHWSVVGTDAKDNATKHVILDGKKADYTGGRVRFTPDNRVVCLQGEDAANLKQRLLVDGKPILSDSAIDGFEISSKGDIGCVALVAGAQKKMAYVNGRSLPGTEDAFQLTFSPDGKRWAATCVASPSCWVVVDGKKQQDYTTVHDVAFTPDSSRIVYIAESGNKKFVVVDGDEGEGNFNITQKPIFGKTGNHYAYCAGQGAGAIKAYYDGKVLPKSYLVFNLTLSPDGTRYAYYGASDALSSQFFVDGQPAGGAGGQGGLPLFSADSKHVAAFAQSPKDRNGIIYVDGGYVAPPQGAGYPKLLGFTGDSQHLVMEAGESINGRPAKAFYVDNKRVAQFSGMGVQWANLTGGMSLWEAQDDGSILFVGAEPVEQGYGPMKRVRVTPDAASNVTTMVADYQAALDKAAADAKQKADDEKAAKDKAAADAKAAQEKAAADKKAAQEKAAADKKAAQEKAAADKKAAQEKAAAERAAKTKKP